MELVLGLWDLVKAGAQKIYVLATAWGGPGLFVVAVADSSFLSVPEGNDLLIIALSIGQGWGRMAYLVLMTIAGSVLGCTLLYAVGRRGGRLIRRISQGRLLGVQETYQKYGVWTLVGASMIPPPMPFKIFVLAAGLFRLPFARFLLAVLLGRSARYFTWGVLAVLFGQSVKHYVEENLPTVGTWALVFVLVSLSSYFLWRRKFGRRPAKEERL
ncbi:MAG: VTT domain-containing protein [Acidobacteria bacterium]|nr:VTT domain-containing protein [Acidobacteriota bacterium]